MTMRSINVAVTRKELDSAEKSVIAASAATTEARAALLRAEAAEQNARSHLSRVRRAIAKSGLVST